MADHRSTAWRWWEDYGDGITSAQDHRLAQVPSTDGRTCTLHWAAASVFHALAAAWLADHPGYRPLLVASGWRPRKAWQATRRLYHAELIRRYSHRLPAAHPDDVIAYGKIRLAFMSTHFAGIALDLGSPPPMRPSTLDHHVAAMRSSEVYRWLMRRAPQMGLRNYLPEPHHWEMPLSRKAWEAAGPEG
jgi:hypothetical protein